MYIDIIMDYMHVLIGDSIDMFTKVIFCKCTKLINSPLISLCLIINNSKFCEIIYLYSATHFVQYSMFDLAHNI